MSLYGNGLYPVGGVPSGATGGGIIQCVQTIKTSATTIASSSYVDVSGMSVTITPRTSSNKILIIVQVSCWMNSFYGGPGNFRLLRGATAIGADPAFVMWNFNQQSGDNYADSENMTYTYIDSPATTSATTYKIQTYNNGARNQWFNYGYDSVTRNCSTITALEVSG